MLEVYYFENSVCSERVLMTLAEKQTVDWTGHHIDLFDGAQANPDYLKLNPKAQVPTLVHDGQIIRESSIICDYLDNISPEFPLKPSDAANSARMREWIKESDESGFQGVGALSFTAVFREKILDMPKQERENMWARQTDLARTYRQKSCVIDGLKSPYAIIALSAWERIFNDLEAALSHGDAWIMGNKFTLADINFAPLIARLEAIEFLSIWVDHRPATRAWWDRVKLRPSFAQAQVGPSHGTEQETFAREGKRIAQHARKVFGEIMANA